MSEILTKVREFARKYLEQYDPSHDYAHVLRVEKNALRIAAEENYQGDLEVIQIASLLHDVGDHKYTGNETDGVKIVTEFLKSVNYPKEKIDRVCFVHSHISFKNELDKPIKNNIELNIIVDSDRLDAMGCIGILRAFTYSAIKNIPFYIDGAKPRNNLDKDTYMKKEENCTISHFYEKLLRLKDLMRTETGKKMAEQRHQYMEEFLVQFYKEWYCKI